MSTLVMKFGGASVATPQHFTQIAKIILDKKKDHPRLVIVVSAMANATAQLISLAREVNPNPPSREYDMLVSVGERISISLLAMALAKLGVQAVSYTGSQSGIMTSEEHSSAKIVDVRPHRIVKTLEQGKVAIIAGFQGCSLAGEITTLGPNGSDISAVAMGVAIGADHVEFYKDVPGIFDLDPKLSTKARHHSHLTYDEADQVLKKGGRILHPRCLELAKNNNLPLWIRSFIDPKAKGTLISDINLKMADRALYELALS